MPRITTRSVNTESIADFLFKLSNENWEILYKLNDLNDIFNLFLHIYILIFETCFPKKTAAKKCIDNGWITVGIRTSCRRKENLFIASRNSNNHLLKEYYKIYCSILKSIIRNAKRTYYNSLLLSSDNKVKTTWKIVEMETGSKKDRRARLPTNFKYRDDKINLEEAAQTFNKHFISIAENLNMNKANVNSAMSYLNKYFTEAFPTMNLLPVTEPEIISIINNLKLTYSSGYDGITNKILKLSSQLISKPMAYIINK